MKTIKDFKKGDTIEVTYIKDSHSGCIDTYTIESKSIINDGRGQILLSTIKRINPNYMPQYYERGINTMVVDSLWFDEELTGRRIKIAPKKN